MKFSTSILLGLSVSALMSIPTFAAPTTVQPTREAAVEWVKSKIGTAIDYDKAYGAQCVDLIKGYSNELWNYYSLRGNAKDYVSNQLPDDWARYSPGQATPEPGDIVVFGGGQFGVSSYGHIGIVYAVDSSKYYYIDYSGAYSGSPGEARSAALGRYTALIKPSFASSVSGLSSASEISNGEYFFENAAGGVLTIDDYTKNGANVNITDISGLYRQMWRIEKLSDGSFKLISMHTGKGVNVSGDGAAARENNKNVWAWDYVNDGTANWYIVSDGDGWYRLICKASGKALSVTSDRNVVQRDSDSGADQKWRLKTKSSWDEAQQSQKNTGNTSNTSNTNNTGNTNNKKQNNTVTWRYDGYGWWLEYSDGSYLWNKWVKVNGSWYYFNYWGYAVNGWEKIDGKWYYFDSDYSMRTGWVKSSGNWYYVDPSYGVLFNTITPDGYYVDEYGICIY